VAPIIRAYAGRNKPANPDRSMDRTIVREPWRGDLWGLRAFSISTESPNSCVR
jgi:hypothetical protein